MRWQSKFLSQATRNYIEEAKKAPSFSWWNFIHGYVYGRWPYLYIGIGKGEHPVAKILLPFVRLFYAVGGPELLLKMRPQKSKKETRVSFSDTYHGKVIAVEQAKKLITINREIRVDDLEKVIPYTRARSIILKNPEHIVVLDCPCRVSSPNPCKPIDVCLIIGEPFASFILEHQPKRAKAITAEKALTILEEEHKRGHVQHAFFKEAMLNRFYAICNCCSCCCGAIHAHKNGTPMLASSGYVGQIDESKCIRCGLCERACQFGAISKDHEGGIALDGDKCLGCGVCMTTCRQEAITLIRNEQRGTPLEAEKLLAAAQKFSMNGPENQAASTSSTNQGKVTAASP